ncbi:MAG: AMP-binding protein, partial [Proteobacteria bacterium]|nr:AMP-binding protein [Pseudomonadota bacterium]
MAALADFIQARNFLWSHRSDYATAYKDFRWPQLTSFNWALDYFDQLALGNDKPALWIVEEDGSQKILSFNQLGERSNQVANYLRSLGVKRGDCMLLMMGNEVPLWELMLAAIKL